MYNFIILSSCSWGGMLQRPHQIARSLSKLNQLVHFIEPAGKNVNTGGEFKDYIKDEIILDYSLKNVRHNDDGVNIYTPVTLINSKNVFEQSMESLIKYLIGQSSLPTCVIYYFPTQIKYFMKDNLSCRVIYDCVDDHTDLTFSYWSSPKDIEYEYQALQSSDIVLTTSKALFLTKSLASSNVYLSKNGVDILDFQKENVSLPEDLKDIPYPRICYMGAVDKWFDETLFYQLVESNPDKSFIIIGPVSNGLLKENYHNLYILGTKPHNELYKYLHNMDIGIIPFLDQTDLIINCDPIKHYEYLACYLPVVSTVLPELCIGKDFIRICSNVNDFNSNIEDLIHYKPDKQEIDDYLYQNSWEHRGKQIIDLIEKTDQDNNNLSIINSFRNEWEKYLNNHEFPILRSLYSLTFATYNPNLFLEEAKQSYKISKVFFIMRNYVFSLYLNDMLEEAIQVILESHIVEDVLQAELKFAISLEDEHLTWIKILHCIKKYDFLRELVFSYSRDETIKEYEIANYHFETGEYEVAADIYKKIMSPEFLQLSPLYNFNFFKLTSMTRLLSDGQKALFRSFEIMDRLFKNEDRFIKWKSMFTQKIACNNCGSEILKLVLQRPDGQNIVSCSNCGLAFLEKIPTNNDLQKLYDLDYYNSSSFSGYNYDYNSENKEYLFLPRLQWIENTRLIKDSKKMLDIGCANGEFLKFAQNYQWDTYGIEISDEGYKESLKKGIKVLNAPLRECKLPDNEFDCVSLWDVIEHLISPIDELKEIYRVLKPNGKLYISTPNHLKGLVQGKDWFGYNASYEHLFYFEPSTIITMLSNVGFKIDDCFSHENNNFIINDPKSIGHVLLVAARK